MSASIAGHMAIRRCEFDDAKLLNTAVSNNGGLATYKASFGAFNFSSIIENSYLMLTANVTNEDESETSINVMSLNDTVTLANSDSTAFTRAIDELKPYIPVTVRITFHIYCLQTHTCLTRFTCRATDALLHRSIIPYS